MSCLFALLDKNFDHVILHSGQHYDAVLDKDLFKELKLKSKIKRLQSGPGNFGEQFSKQISALYHALEKEKADFVIVQGDTNTALSGALVAARLKIKVIHVEAGCRSGNPDTPEEQNRILIDAISSLRFCPDQRTLSNLNKEGHKSQSYISGSTTFDAIKRSGMLSTSSILKQFNLASGQFVLCTLHRVENMDNLAEFKKKIEFINWISTFMPVVFPIHPRTKIFLEKQSIQLAKEVIAGPPLSHLKFVGLLKNCRLVVSDSGGIQEEAAFFDRPCLVLRNETEWTRLLKIKKNFLFSQVKEKEKKLTKRLLIDDRFYHLVQSRKCPESKPGASQFIIKHIKMFSLKTVK